MRVCLASMHLDASFIIVAKSAIKVNIGSDGNDLAPFFGSRSPYKSDPTSIGLQWPPCARFSPIIQAETQVADVGNPRS
jgi:hypothetical protein